MGSLFTRSPPQTEVWGRWPNHQGWMSQRLQSQPTYFLRSCQSTSGEQVTQSNYSDALRGQAEGCRITSVDALDDRTSRSTRALTYYTSYK